MANYLTDKAVKDIIDLYHDLMDESIKNMVFGREDSKELRDDLTWCRKYLSEFAPEEL